MDDTPRVLGNHEHNWPHMGGHLFGPWLSKNQKEKYRTCVHPYCTAVEIEPVSKA